MSEALKKINSKNLAIIFTFIEDDPDDCDMEWAQDWLEELFRHVELDCPPEENIFLFKGKDKNGHPKTPGAKLA